MAGLTDRDIEEIARRIASDIRSGVSPVAVEPPPSNAASQATQGLGIFSTVDEAINAAKAAQPKFAALPLIVRAKIIEAMRATMRENGDKLAKAAWEETGLGRYEDKIIKNRLVTDKTPGLEDLAPIATSGDHGLTLVEPAPFGVIGAITPVTNPT